MSNDVVDEQRILPSKLWLGCRIASTLFKNLVYFAVVFLAFGKLQSVFETIALCLLILIYQAVNWNDAQRARTDFEEGLLQRRFSLAILKKLGEETGDTVEEVDEIELKFRQGNPIYYINLTGSLIVYLVVVWKLVVALV